MAIRTTDLGHELLRAFPGRLAAGFPVPAFQVVDDPFKGCVIAAAAVGGGALQMQHMPAGTIQEQV